MRREPWIAVAMLALAACSASASGEQTTANAPVALTPSTVVTSTVPLVTSSVESEDASVFAAPGPTPISSCAVEYSPETLSARSWAFDGTLIAVGNVGDSQLGAVPSATFNVNTWYRGGSTPQVTVQFETGMISEFVPEVTTGTRLLVSGEPRWGGQPLDDAVAWGCGFTQPWTAAAAQQWTDAIRS